jgi:putative nucleotidyltransferase with HDIG domain
VNTVNMKDHTRTITYINGDRFPGNRVGEVHTLAGTRTEQVVRTKSSLLTNSKNREDVIRKLPGMLSRRSGSQTTMLIPLISKDEVFGVLNVQSAKIDAYSENALLLAERVGAQIAGAIANAQLFRERIQVEEKLQNTLDSLRNAVRTTIQVMVSTVEARDPYTAGHQIRSADLARAIATEMGFPQEKIESIRMVGTIHDIGKISIPAEILSKPTKLSELEFSLIKEHARRGFEMLKDVQSPWPLAEIVYQHHERMDGSGYPRNLKGAEICMEARILTVADVVEAMASHRPYRAGLGIDAALNEIEKNRGIAYDVAVADACLRLFREKDFKLAGA